MTASNPAKLERQNSYHSNRYEHDGITVLQKNKRIRVILVIVLFRARIENNDNFINNAISGPLLLKVACSIATLTYVMILCHLVEKVLNGGFSKTKRFNF